MSFIPLKNGRKMSIGSLQAYGTLRKYEFYHDRRKKSTCLNSHLVAVEICSCRGKMSLETKIPGGLCAGSIKSRE